MTCKNCKNDITAHPEIKNVKLYFEVSVICEVCDTEHYMFINPSELKAEGIEND